MRTKNILLIILLV